MDCNGDCGGSAFGDNCGVCTGGYIDSVFYADQDCSGECFGTAEIDACGDCNSKEALRSSEYGCDW